MLLKLVFSGILLFLPVFSDAKVFNLHGKPSIKVSKKMKRPDIWSNKPITNTGISTPHLMKKLKLSKRGLHPSGIKKEGEEELALGKKDVDIFANEEVNKNRHLEGDVMEDDLINQDVYEHVKVQTGNKEISDKKSSNSDEKAEKIVSKMKNLLKEKLSEKADTNSESFKRNLSEKPNQHYEVDGIEDEGYYYEEGSDSDIVEAEENIDRQKQFKTKFLPEESGQKHLYGEQNYIKETVSDINKEVGKKFNVGKVTANTKESKKIAFDDGIWHLNGHKDGKVKETISKSIENLKNRVDDKTNNLEGFLRGRNEGSNDGVEQKSKWVVDSMNDDENDQTGRMSVNDLFGESNIKDGQNDVKRKSSQTN